MKKHLSAIVFGCLGVCAGFTLCYVFFVIPSREANPAASKPFPQIMFYGSKGNNSQLDWRPYLIQPMLPPKIIGRYEVNGR